MGVERAAPVQRAERRDDVLEYAGVPRQPGALALDALAFGAGLRGGPLRETRILVLETLRQRPSALGDEADQPEGPGE